MTPGAAPPGTEDRPARSLGKDTGRAVLHDAPGPECKECHATEARCAWLSGTCCADCDHWRAFTPDGEIREREHGTQRGYDQHRYRREKSCEPCKAAHAEDQRRRSLARAS